MNNFTTLDMYFAATLMAYGAELITIDKSDRRKQEFIFTGNIPTILVYTDNGFFIVIQNPSFEDIKSRYEANRLYFPPAYPDAIRKIKSAIYS